MLIIPLNAINPRVIKSAVIAEMKSNTAAADYTGRRIPSRVNEFKWTERSPVRSAQNVNSINLMKKRRFLSLCSAVSSSAKLHP